MKGEPRLCMFLLLILKVKKKHKENIAFKFKYGSFILFSWAKTDEESCTFDWIFFHQSKNQKQANQKGKEIYIYIYFIFLSYSKTIICCECDTRRRCFVWTFWLFSNWNVKKQQVCLICFSVFTADSIFFYKYYPPSACEVLQWSADECSVHRWLLFKINYVPFFPLSYM